MKKIVYSFCALCAISALTVGYTSIASNANAKSATTLANIEALSSDSESSSDSGAPKCTGPKVNGECQCTNGQPCRDNSGC